MQRNPKKYKSNLYATGTLFVAGRLKKRVIRLNVETKREGIRLIYRINCRGRISDSGRAEDILIWAEAATGFEN